MESPHYSYSITPQAKGAYASESKEVVDTLYIRISNTTNGRFFRVGTVDSSWKKLKQLFHSAFSSDKYLRGEEAKRLIYFSDITNDHGDLDSRMIKETTGSIYYTSGAEENLTQVDGPDALLGNLYMRIHHHKDASGIERTTYKAGSAETTWKKIKHWFKNAFSSTKYLYGFAAREEIYTIKNREQPLLDGWCLLTPLTSAWDTYFEAEKGYMNSPPNDHNNKGEIVNFNNSSDSDTIAPLEFDID